MCYLYNIKIYMIQNGIHMTDKQQHLSFSTQTKCVNAGKCVQAFCKADAIFAKAHTATVTWAFALFQVAQKEKPLHAKEEELGVVLELLSAPFSGALLRGAPAALASTLIDVATKQRKTQEPSASATYDVNADIVPAICTLALLPNNQDSLEHLLVHLIRVTHRHPRVISSAAFAAGVLRSLLLQPKASVDRVVQDAKLFAVLTLKYYSTLLDPALQGQITHAQHALEHICALMLQARVPDVVGFPAGLNGKDSPEQMVAWAILLAYQKAKTPKEVIADLRMRQPTAYIALPLYAMFAAARSLDLDFKQFEIEQSSEGMAACFTACVGGQINMGLEGLLFEEYALSNLVKQHQKDDSMHVLRHEKLAQLSLF